MKVAKVGLYEIADFAVLCYKAIFLQKQFNKKKKKKQFAESLRVWSKIFLRSCASEASLILYVQHILA